MWFLYNIEKVYKFCQIFRNKIFVTGRYIPKSEHSTEQHRHRVVIHKSCLVQLYYRVRGCVRVIMSTCKVTLTNHVIRAQYCPRPGHGTYTQHGYIYSSLVGELRLVTNTDNTVTVEVDGLKEDSLVPGQQDIVTVKIVSVNPRWVLLSVYRTVR